MIESIKRLYRAIQARIRHFLDKVIVSIHSALKWLIWPKWYFVVLFVIMPLVAFHVVGLWFNFAWPAVGLVVLFVKKKMP